jgi:hypothetical protein
MPVPEPEVFEKRIQIFENAGKIGFAEALKLFYPGPDGDSDLPPGSRVIMITFSNINLTFGGKSITGNLTLMESNVYGDSPLVQCLSKTDDIQQDVPEDLVYVLNMMLLDATLRFRAKKDLDLDMEVEFTTGY